MYKQGAHLVGKVFKAEAAPQQHALLPVLRKHLCGAVCVCVKCRFSALRCAGRPR